MAEYPFIVSLTTTLAANGEGTLRYDVDPNATLIIHKILKDSTGIFNIKRIYDSTGRNYLSIDNAVGVSSEIFPQMGEDFKGFYFDLLPLSMDDNNVIYFDLLDTSTSSNAIKLALLCTRITAN